MSPKDFFLQLGILITLYASGTALITVLFQIINYIFIDTLFGYYDPYSGAIRFAIATLIIMFPVFLVLSWLNAREYAAFPEKRNLWIHRWATYITLFIGSVVILVDLVVLLNVFLGGEITVRFLLKVLAVLAVAGIVFGYYLYDIRRANFASSLPTRIFAGISVVFVLASIVTSFAVVGGPITQRLLRYDDEKIQSLQQIQYMLTDHVRAKGALPETLTGLAGEIKPVSIPQDPQSGEAYGYTRIDDVTFSLCADFNQASRPGTTRSYYGVNESWEHPEGNHCFTRTIDTDFIKTQFID